jgi:uncharacterized membrane-anchored protein
MKMPAVHPHRDQISSEILSLPYEPISPPGRILYIVMAADPDVSSSQRAHLDALQEMDGARVIENSPSRVRCDLGRISLNVKFEQSFTRFKFTWRPEMPREGSPFVDSVPDGRLVEWIEEIPGLLLTSVDAAILEFPPDMRSREEELIERYGSFFKPETLVASHMGRSANLVMTDFQITEDRTIRMLVFSQAPRAAQNGRLILRLMEVETYRILGMLTLPHARALLEKLPTIDRQLNELTDDIARADGKADEKLLQEITALAGEVERLVARYYRDLSQANEYFDITFKRLQELREQAIPEIPSIAGTLETRLEPAVDACRSAAKWLDQVSLRTSYATHLLRTRVDVKREEQNQQLLKGVKQRFQTQLRLQETAELFSIVVIPYYAANLVGYITEMVNELIHSNVDIVTAKAISIPLVVVLVYILLGRSKKDHDYSD